MCLEPFLWQLYDITFTVIFMPDSFHDVFISSVFPSGKFLLLLACLIGPLSYQTCNLYLSLLIIFLYSFLCAFVFIFECYFEHL